VVREAAVERGCVQRTSRSTGITTIVLDESEVLRLVF